MSKEDELCIIAGSQTACIDLSYPLNNSTIFWPNGEGFNLCLNCSTDPSTGDFYSAGTISCAEHCGTHVDAPYHFAAHGITVDLIPLNKLIGQCVVLDITERCTVDADGRCDYQLTPEDVLIFENEHGMIPPSSIVLVHSGWSGRYNSGALAYLGFDERIHGPYDVNTSALSFPGISKKASELLVSRGVAAVGIDTASLDPGSSKDFISHKVLLGAGIYGIENINTNINRLPPVGTTLMVMPMKITGASGSPARVVAFLQK